MRSPLIHFAKKNRTLLELIFYRVRLVCGNIPPQIRECWGSHLLLGTGRGLHPFPAKNNVWGKCLAPPPLQLGRFVHAAGDRIQKYAPYKDKTMGRVFPVPCVLFSFTFVPILDIFMSLVCIHILEHFNVCVMRPVSLPPSMRMFIWTNP